MAPRMIGLLLLVLGAILLFMGWNASQSFTEGVREGLTGRYSDATTWYLLGGAVAAVAGVALMLLPGRRRV